MPERLLENKKHMPHRMAEKMPKNMRDRMQEKMFKNMSDRKLE